MPNPYFKFKQFTVFHDQCAMKVGTDGVLLGSWAGDNNANYKSIIDIGSGTGLIALMLSQRFRKAKVKAVEIESKCAKQCEKNLKSSPFNKEVSVENKSIQEFTKSTESQFDLLVSNPPFFIDAFTSDDDQRNMARHNSTLKQHDLWQSVTELSHGNSEFVVILPIKEGELFVDKSKEYPWFLKEQVFVKGSPEAKEKRVLLLFAKHKAPLNTSQLIVEKTRGVYTDDFIELVKDFYLFL